MQKDHLVILLEDIRGKLDLVLESFAVFDEKNSAKGSMSWKKRSSSTRSRSR